MAPLTEGAENSGQDDPDGTVVVEDAAKDDMFVDCPDELAGNADGKEAVAATETQGSLMEETPCDMQQEIQYEIEKVSLMDEVENTRATLNGTIFEKENVVHDFEVHKPPPLSCGSMLLSGIKLLSFFGCLIFRKKEKLLCKNFLSFVANSRLLLIDSHWSKLLAIS